MGRRLALRNFCGERAPNPHGRRVQQDQALDEALDDQDEAIKDQNWTFRIELGYNLLHRSGDCTG